MLLLTFVFQFYCTAFRNERENVFVINTQYFVGTIERVQYKFAHSDRNQWYSQDFVKGAKSFYGPGFWRPIV